MTSFRAVKVKLRSGIPYAPAVVTKTPVAVVPLNKILRAREFLKIVGAVPFSSAACKKLDSEDERYPFLGSTVNVEKDEPLSTPALRLLISFMPTPMKAFCAQEPKASA